MQKPILDILAVYKKIFLSIFLLITCFITFLTATDYTKSLAANIEAQDFTAYYTGTQLLLNHKANSLYNQKTQAAHQKIYATKLVQLSLFKPFLNPPFVTLLFLPFAFIPLPFAYFIWMVINIALAAAIIIMAMRKFKTKGWGRVFGIEVFIAFPPFLYTIISGQLSLFLLFSFFLTELFYVKGEKILAGVSLSLLALKPQFLFVPLLFFFIRKEYKVLASATVTLVCVSLFSLLMVGVKEVVVYIQFLLQTMNWQNTYTVNPQYTYTFRGLLQLLTKSYSLSSIFLPWATLSACFLLVWAYITRKTPNFTYTWYLCIITTILVSPYISDQDLLVLVLPILYFTFQNYQQIKARIGSEITDLLIFFGFIPTITTSYMINTLHVLLELVGIMILWVYFAIKGIHYTSKKSPAVQIARA